jgi:hypothetical protein
MYTRQHVLCKKVINIYRHKIGDVTLYNFHNIKTSPNVPRLCGTACIVLHLVALNTAGIGLAYLTGIVMVLPAFRSDS